MRLREPRFPDIRRVLAENLRKTGDEWLRREHLDHYAPEMLAEADALDAGEIVNLPGWLVAWAAMKLGRSDLGHLHSCGLVKLHPDGSIEIVSVEEPT